MANSKFVHVVYFWLKEDLSTADIDTFKAGARSLGMINTVDSFYFGKPAQTPREVVDNSYSYCIIVAFADKEAHDAYQTDIIHDRFREDCGHLWNKVQIYDAIAE